MKIEQNCSYCGIRLIRDKENHHPVCFDCKMIRKREHSRQNRQTYKQKKKTAVHRLSTINMSIVK